jgi:hypothetical protein
MAIVHNFLEIWQGNQNLWATQLESRGQKRQMTAVGCISDTDVMVEASWSLFQPDGAADFKLSEKSPVPPAFNEKDLPRGWNQIPNIRWTKWIYRHPAESDEDSSPESISDTETGLTGKGNWIIQMTVSMTAMHIMN